MNESGRTPSRREILKPLELIVLSAVFGVFTGLITLMATRDPIFAAIAFGIAFIVSLIAIAMFALAVKPDDFERKDLEQQNDAGSDRDAGPDLPRGH